MNVCKTPNYTAMQVKPTDLIYAVSLTDSMPSQNEAKAFMKVQLNFQE